MDSLAWVFSSFEPTLLCVHEKDSITSVDGKFDIGVHGFPFSGLGWFIILVFEHVPGGSKTNMA